MEIYFYLPILFVLGAALASFTNSLSDNIPDLDKRFLKGRSVCDNCGKDLLWWEMIPILGWLMLRGKCSSCRKPIAWYYPLSEFLLGLAFLLAGCFIYADTWLLLGSLVFIAILYFFSIYDIKKGIVPNNILLFIIIATTLLQIVLAVILSSYANLLGLLVSGIVYFLFFAVMNFLTVRNLFPGVKDQEGFGWGDAKYAFWLGLVLGPEKSLISLWVAVFSGALVGVILLAIYRKRHMKMPFVPFMSFGAFAALLFSEPLMNVVKALLKI